MNKSIEVLKKIYKPYRYTILGKVTILNTTSGDFVVKEKCEKDIKELFSYLKVVIFIIFPNLLMSQEVMSMYTNILKVLRCQKNKKHLI